MVTTKRWQESYLSNYESKYILSPKISLQPYFSIHLSKRNKYRLLFIGIEFKSKSAKVITILCIWTSRLEGMNYFSYFQLIKFTTKQKYKIDCPYFLIMDDNPTLEIKTVKLMIQKKETVGIIEKRITKTTWMIEF